MQFFCFPEYSACRAMAIPVLPRVPAGQSPDQLWLYCRSILVKMAALFVAQGAWAGIRATMTQEYSRVATTDEVLPGKMKCVQVHGRRILLANVDGNIFAADDMCTHEDASLCTGSLHGEYVKCPLHGSRFNLRTGQVMEEPADENLRVYPVRLDGNVILVGTELEEFQ
jgi:3-phenylpropionate/trans-cinnamate dioxygenase ferredoxin subunit